MEVWVFPSEEALHVALRSGLVPAAAQRAAVSVGVTQLGELELSSAEFDDRSAEGRTLKDSGIARRAPTVPGSARSCWAEVLAPVRSELPAGSTGSILFSVPHERSLLELAGELLRLGCDRQELASIAQGLEPLPHALLEAVDPPWFVLSRALDHLDAVRAFRPVTPQRRKVWVEAGWSHPLEASIAEPESGLVLITREGRWWRLEAPTWTALDHLVVPALLPAPTTLEPRQNLPRIEVALRFGRSHRTEVPTLFVIPDGLVAVEALIRSTTEALLDNVLFAVAGSVVVLRLRPGREAGGGALPGAPYVRLHELPNLFVPAGLTLEPPVRRDRVRSWLAPDPEVLTWLAPTEKGFTRLSVPETAFRPLAEWVDYVLDGAGATLETWAKSARFDFEPFVAAEEQVPPRPAASAAAPRPAAGGEEQQVEPVRPKAPPSRWSESRLPAVKDPALPPEPTNAAAPIELPQSLSEVEAVVAREEAAFLELEAPADSDARRTAWVRLAELYARVQRPRDAGMAWAHAVWEASADDAAPLVRRWMDTSGARLESVAGLTNPNVEQTRAAVAHLVSASIERNPAVAARVTEWVGFLDRFSEDLDVRSEWLGRVAVSRLAGGDPLGLARARDRVLHRLQGGLSLDRDVPRLLRVTGQGGAANVGGGRAQRVTAQLESLLKAFEETPRKRSAIEAPPQLTHAYVSFEFAWAFARLAHPERARQLRDRALGVLDAKDPVHHYLTKAYSARIEQALEGLAPSTPLPPEVNALLTGLEALDRYKVDRLRLFSQVLEPQERLEPTVQFLRSREKRGEELGVLRSLREPAELLKAIESRAGATADVNLSVEERTRLIDGLIDYLPQLPESQALPLLQRFLGVAERFPANHRAVVLEDALKIAGHFGRAALVKQLVLQLGSAIKEVGSEGMDELGGMLVSGVRSLRRVGLREEASELLARASTVLKGEDVKALQARLGLASGFMYLGAAPQAQPIVDEAIARLSRESTLNISERMKLSRAAAQALSHAPTELALPGLVRLSQQLPWITDSFNTNGTTGPDGKHRAYFCISMVDFADTLVLGHVGDDLTLNETTRRFLDEDEYLVRRRVHRDVGESA